MKNKFITISMLFLIAIAVNSLAAPVIQTLPPDTGIVCGSKGDLNNDNIINIFDLLKLLKAISNQATYQGNECADIDNNNAINIFDLLKMLQWLKEGLPQAEVSVAASRYELKWLNNINSCSSVGCRALSKPENCDESNLNSLECKTDKDCAKCKAQFGTDKNCIADPSEDNKDFGPYYIVNYACYTGIGSGTDISFNKDWWYTACECPIGAAEIEVTGEREITLEGITISIRVEGTKTGTLDIKKTEENPITKIGKGIGTKKALNKFITIESNLEITKATVKIPYNENELGTIQEASLRLYNYNAETGYWEILANSGVDIDNNYVYGDKTHFSMYKIMVGGDEVGIELWYEGKKCSQISICDPIPEFSIYDSVECKPLDDSTGERCKTIFPAATIGGIDASNGPYYNPSTNSCYKSSSGSPKDALPYSGSTYYKGCMCAGRPAQKSALAENQFIIWKSSTANCAGITYVDSMRDDAANIDKRDDLRADNSNGAVASRTGIVTCTAFVDSGCLWCKDKWSYNNWGNGVVPQCNLKNYMREGSIFPEATNVYGRGPGFSKIYQGPIAAKSINSCYSGRDASGCEGTSASFESPTYYKACLCAFGCVNGAKQRIVNAVDGQLNIMSYEECVNSVWIQKNCGQTEHVIGTNADIKCELQSTTTPNLGTSVACTGDCGKCISEESCWNSGCSWKVNKDGKLDSAKLCVNEVSNIDSYPNFEKNGHKYLIAAYRHDSESAGISLPTSDNMQFVATYYCNKKSKGYIASNYETTERNLADLPNVPDLILFPSEVLYEGRSRYFTKIECGSPPGGVPCNAETDRGNKICDSVTKYKTCISTLYGAKLYDWSAPSPCPEGLGCLNGECIGPIPSGVTVKTDAQCNSENPANCQGDYLFYNYKWSSAYNRCGPTILNCRTESKICSNNQCVSTTTTTTPTPAPSGTPASITADIVNNFVLVQSAVSGNENEINKIEFNFKMIDKNPKDNIILYLEPQNPNPIVQYGIWGVEIETLDLNWRADNTKKYSKTSDDFVFSGVWIPFVEPNCYDPNLERYPSDLAVADMMRTNRENANVGYANSFYCLNNWLKEQGDGIYNIKLGYFYDYWSWFSWKTSSIQHNIGTVNLVAPR